MKSSGEVSERSGPGWSSPLRQTPAFARRAGGTLEAIFRSPHLLLFAAYLLGSPFYVLRSGLPQPADFVMVALIALTAIWTGLRFPRGSARSRRALLHFVLYACAVNIGWALLTGNFTLAKKTSMIITPLFFCFNGLVFATYLALYGRFRRRLLSVTILMAAISVILQAALATRFLSATAFRQELFFNNPNQLGYYVLLSATIVAIGSKYLKLKLWFQAIFFSAVLYLVMLSLSKAALISVGLLLIVSFSRRIPVLLITVALLLGAFQFTGIGTVLVDNAAVRIGRIGSTQDDTFAARGYDRISAHPEYLILGAGEGADDRFDSEFSGELHSTLGTVLFSYGIIGSFLFLRFLFSIIGWKRFSILLHVTPVFVYGMAHHGLRFTHFWLLWAFVLCLLIEARGRAPELPSWRARKDPGRELLPATDGAEPDASP